MVDQNIAQAQYLAKLVDTSPVLERMAPVPLNIVCFRFNPGGKSNEELNELNQELLIKLHESGIAAPSYTTLNGNYMLRVAITNHRSKQDDFDVFVKSVVEIGLQLTDHLDQVG
jgi:glutamate/tyrosine decarboxylase-like PLP-dependent enzyme